MKHFLLTYTLASDYLARRPEFRAEHLALATAAVARGDPYVVSGLVTAWRVRAWVTVVGAGAARPGAGSAPDG